MITGPVRKLSYRLDVRESNPFFDPEIQIEDGPCSQLEYTAMFEDGTKVIVLDHDMGFYGGDVYLTVLYPDGQKHGSVSCDKGYTYVSTLIDEKAVPYLFSLGIPYKLDPKSTPSRQSQNGLNLYPKAGVVERMRELAKANK